MLRISTLILVCLIFISCTKENSTVPDTEALSINEELQAVFKNSELPGFSLVVVNDEKILFQKSYGFSDLENATAYSDSSVQAIASISKTFIALAMMKAVEQGYINMDTDINEYLPFKVINPHHPQHKITLRHLSQHASGIVDVDEIYDRTYVLRKGEAEKMNVYSDEVQDYFSGFERHQTFDESVFLEKYLTAEGEWFSTDNFHDKAPGAHYEYSNIGATLAAYVIENAVNMPFEEYTQKYIFNPLQMTQTNWSHYDLQVSNAVKNYLPKDQLIPQYHIVTLADGALFTSSDDFAKYLIEMMKGYNGMGSLLAPDSYQTIFHKNEFNDKGVGVFWSISSQGHPNHNGADPGVFTMTGFDPERNVGFFLMTNVSAHLDEEMIQSIRAILKSIRTFQQHSR